MKYLSSTYNNRHNKLLPIILIKHRLLITFLKSHVFSENAIDIFLNILGYI
jgi:hypothetical protein